jgi:hypothetical protein
MKHRLPVGVSWYRTKQSYRAQTKLKGKVCHLGYFDCPFSAYIVYLLAKREEVNRELTAHRKLKAFFTKATVDRRFAELESRGLQAIRLYLNEREATQ